MIQARLEGFDQDERGKDHEDLPEERKQQEDSFKEEGKKILDGGLNLPEDTPDAKEKKDAWSKNAMKFLRSDDAKELYKNAGILFCIWMLSLMMAFIKIHVGKIQK